MISVFANAAPEPLALQQFLVIVSFFASMAASAASVAAWVGSRRVQRREITFGRELVSKEELVHLVKDIARVEGNLSALRAELKHDWELRTAALGAGQDKLERRLDNMVNAMTALNNRLEDTR